MGISFVIKAREEKTEERLFARWVSMYQYSMSYEEFKQSLQPQEETSTKTEEELLNDVKSMLG